MSQTRVLISPKPRAILPQQPQVAANLQESTLATGTPLKPYLHVMVMGSKSPQTIQYLNLQASTLAPAAVAAPFKPLPHLTIVRRAVTQTIAYPNLLTNTLEPQLYFLNDSGFTPLPRPVLRIQQLPNLQMSTLAPAAAAAPFIPALLPQTRGKRLVPEETLQSGWTQTYGTQPLPFNQYQWPIRVRVNQIPQSTQQAPSLALLSVSDTTPDQFRFDDQNNVAISTAITSNTIIVSGINAAANISVTGGTYSINGGAFTAIAGTVNNGDTVAVRHTSAATKRTDTDTTLTIGGISDTFTSTTLNDGAGHHRPHRHYVEIDGQSFPVANETQALDLLRQARALAERQADMHSERVTKVLRKKAAVPIVKIEAPKIAVAAEFAQAAAPLIADIERLYAKAAERAELRLLLERQMKDEDDDEEILLLI